VSSSFGNPLEKSSLPPSDSMPVVSESPVPQKALSKGSSPITGPFPSTPFQETCPSSALQDRLAINQLTTLRNCLASDLHDYQRFGIPAIGLHWRKLLRYGVRRSLRRIQQSGMVVSSLGWISGFTGDHSCPLNDVISEGRRIIRFAGQVNAKTVTVITGPQGGHIRSHALRIVTDSLKELSDLAAVYGVTLAVQPMHMMYARNWSFLNSIDETLALLDRVNHPHLQMAFGAYHLWEENDLLRRAGEIASRIRLVSLADWSDAPRHENDRLLPGEGRLPLTDLISALEQNGYAGWYEMEVWSRDLWNLESREVIRQCVAARDRLADQIINR